jgi:hypothetical protein
VCILIWIRRTVTASCTTAGRPRSDICVKLYVYYELSDLKSTAEIASSMKLYAALTAADMVRVHTVFFCVSIVFFLTHHHYAVTVYEFI